MCPERVRIFFIEDHEGLVETRSEYLEMAGHSVVLTANSRQEAVDKIPLIEDLGIEVVILDGNLSEGDSSGTDGRYLAKVIKEKYPHIKIVGTSAGSDIEGVDITCRKQKGAAQLVETVTRI